MSQHVDVLIVGAGISGIGAAVHLQKDCPNRSYTILEGRGDIGGTWDLFRYPGIRSDSDMYTLGYAFKPWTSEKAIADAPSIMAYLRETVAEYNLADAIQYNRYVTAAHFSTSDARWQVEVTNRETGAAEQYTCNFLFMCTGYYNYDKGYCPEFAGQNDFKGTVVHPQHWDESLDYSDKKVVVIGSGATAVTLVPAMAETAGHVTMLQRSPTYMVSRPDVDAFANNLRRWLPSALAYGITRWRNVLFGMYFFNLCRRKPRRARAYILGMLKDNLPEGYDIDTHFTPRYNPWEQRLCLVPNADMFKAIGDGRASVVTDTIKCFTESGIELESGAQLEADIIVTATGLELQMLSGATFTVDGKAVNPPDTFNYKGMMYSDVPNLASCMGYTNASWTLKCDLTCDYVCRLLNHMDRNDLDIATPVLGEQTPEEVPLLDFSSGYVQRALDRLPKQGAEAPWKLHQNYFLDMAALRLGKLEDGTLAFSKARPVAESPEEDTIDQIAAG